MPPVMPEATPRFVLIDNRGGEWLLSADHKPLYFRPRRGDAPEPINPNTNIPPTRSMRDIWHNGSNPRHNADSAWAVREELRQWRLWSA